MKALLVALLVGCSSPQSATLDAAIEPDSALDAQIDAQPAAGEMRGVWVTRYAWTTQPQLEAIIFVNLFAYLAVAYLACLLSAKLRQVDVQLKDASGALESLQALHENIIQSISGGLITTNIEGKITLLNIAAKKLLSCGDELIGKSVLLVGH